MKEFSRLRLAGRIEFIQNSGMKTLLLIFGMLAAGYLAAALYCTLFQSRMVFLPTRQLHSDPGDAGLDFVDVRFTAGDGVPLHGWYTPHPRPRGTVLFSHGNGGNIGMRVETVRFFHSLGLSSFIYDYRGYGQSGGEPSESGVKRDALAAWTYLMERGERPERVVLWGRSLGSVVSIILAATLNREGLGRPAGLVAESGFTSVPDLGVYHYPWLPVRLLAWIRFNAKKVVAEVGCPMFIAHSPEDEIVPYELGRGLYEAAAEPKEFFDIHGDHNGGWMESMDVYEPAVRGFLDRVLPASRE